MADLQLWLLTHRPKIILRLGGPPPCEGHQTSDSPHPMAGGMGCAACL